MPNSFSLRIVFELNTNSRRRSIFVVESLFFQLLVKEPLFLSNNTRSFGSSLVSTMQTVEIALEMCDCTCSWMESFPSASASSAACSTMASLSSSSSSCNSRTTTTTTTTTHLCSCHLVIQVVTSTVSNPPHHLDDDNVEERNQNSLKEDRNCCFETTITTTTIHPLTSDASCSSPNCDRNEEEDDNEHDKEDERNENSELHYFISGSSSEMQSSSQYQHHESAHEEQNSCYYYEPPMESAKDFILDAPMTFFHSRCQKESSSTTVQSSSQLKAAPHHHMTSLPSSSSTLLLDHIQNCVVEISDHDATSKKSLFKHPERVFTLFNVTSIVFMVTLLLDFYGPLFSPSFLFQTIAVCVFGMYSVYNRRQAMISFYAIFISISFAITLSETLLLTCYGHSSSGLILHISNWFHLIRFLLTLVLSLSLLIASFHIRVEVARLNALRRQFIASCFDNNGYGMKKNYQIPLLQQTHFEAHQGEDLFVTQNKV